MQNFEDGKIPVVDNKVVTLRDYALKSIEPWYDHEEAIVIVNWLIEHFCHLSPVQVKMDAGLRIDQSVLINLCNAIDDLKRGRPIQYVIGELVFYRLTFAVNESVLIPRPETEELVDRIVKENRNITGLKVMDVGTGSGCIAVSLAANLKEANVVGIDVSVDALQVAKQNARKNNVKVNFQELDILSESERMPIGWNIIVSNPPYIDTNEMASMNRNVLNFEPHQALFAPKDNPMIFYKKLSEVAVEFLVSGGSIYVETHEARNEEVLKIFKHAGLVGVESFNDLMGKPRFVKAQKAD